MDSEARIVANTLLSYLARSVRAIVAFLLVPFLIASLGEEIYGITGIVTSVIGLVVVIELGIRPATTRQFARFLFAGETVRSNELASTGMAGFLILAAVMLSVTGALGTTVLEWFQVAEHLRPEGGAALFVAAASLGVALVTTPYTAALASQLRHDIQHYAEIISTLFRGGFIVLVFSLWEPRLIVWALAALLAATIALLIARWQSYVQCPSLELRRKMVSRRGALDLLGVGAYTSIAQVAAWLELQSGPLVISYFLGPVAVAHYVPAMILATSLQSISRGFLFQLQPFVTKAAVEENLALIRRVLFRSTRYSLLLTGGTSALIASLSPLIVRCWLGEGFQDTALALIFWCGAIFFQSCVGGAFSIFLGAGRLGTLAAANAAVAVLSICVSVLLVGMVGLGVAGVAVGILSAQIVRTIVWIRGAARIAGAQARDYVRSSYAGPLVCIASVIAISLGLQHLITAGPWHELAFAGIPSLLLFGGLTWTIGLDAQDRSKALAYVGQGWSWATEFLRRA